MSITQALKSSLSLAIAIVHLDTAARLAVQKILFHEIHLAFTTSIIVILPCFVALSLYLSLVSKLNKRPPSEEQTKRVLFYLSSFVVIITCLGILITSMKLSSMREESYFSQTLLFTTQPLLVTLIITALYTPLLNPSSRLKRFVSHYVFISSFFIAGVFAQDLYQYFNPSITTKSSEKKNAERNSLNVILITLDTVRADYLSVHNPKLKTTPNLLKLAKKSVVFDKAQAITSWTLPSHASIFTGQYTYKHGASGVHQLLDKKASTLAELLGSKGYDTAGFVGNPYCKAKFGLAQGFEIYQDRVDFFEFKHTYDLFSFRKLVDSLVPSLWKIILHSDGEKTAPELNRAIFPWLSNSRRKEHPFFLFINYYDAHDPYTLGAEFRTDFSSQSPLTEQQANDLVHNYLHNARQRFTKLNLPQDQQNFIKALYKAELRYLDKHLGKLLSKLEKLNLLENTVLIITSDHGEEFFEHGGLNHSLTLNKEVLHVPLIIHAPTHFVNKRIGQQVSIMDIAPTVLDLAGITVPTDMDGKNLIPLINDETHQLREELLSQLYPNAGKSSLTGITTEKWKLIQASPEKGRIKNSLFHRPQDPYEQENLYNEKESIVADMSKRISKFDIHQ